MSFRFVLQYRPATGGEHWWKFKEEMKITGWTLKGSGDGTTSGSLDGVDRLDPGGPYNGSLDVDESWFVLQEPAGGIGREFVIQLKNPSRQWLVYYSSNGTGFEGGGPATRPSGSDEQEIFTVGDNHLPEDTTYISDYIMGDINEGFSFHVAARKLNEDRINSSLFLDVLDQTRSLDADGAVVGSTMDARIDNNYAVGSDLFNESRGTTNIIGTLNGWFKKGFPDEAWVQYTFPGFRFEGGSNLELWENDATVDPNTGTSWDFTCFYSRHSNQTNAGFKGVSRLFKKTVDTIGGGTRAYGDLSRVAFRAISLPWDGKTKPSY